MTTPFLSVCVNRFGFAVLNVKFNCGETQDVRCLVQKLLASVCNSCFEDEYNTLLTEVFKDKENPYRQFYIGDDLVSLEYEVIKDKY